uniref:Uncharacterized protein n=1 Tax=Sus scrofa TaxID=9823 RepID=A0A8D0W957_PIG
MYHLLKRLSFSHCIFLPFLSKINYRCVGLCLGFVFCSIDICFFFLLFCFLFFLLVPHYFDYCSFAVLSEI